MPMATMSPRFGRQHLVVGRKCGSQAAIKIEMLPRAADMTIRDVVVANNDAVCTPGGHRAE